MLGCPALSTGHDPLEKGLSVSIYVGTKVGTVTMDVTTAVKNAKAGQVQYRTDKAGIVHATIGRASFEADKLEQNLRALIDALQKAKPAAAKGVYLKKMREDA